VSESVWDTVRCENTLVKTKLGLQRGPRTNFKTGWAIKSCGELGRTIRRSNVMEDRQRQTQNGCFPTCLRGFDSLRLLQYLAEIGLAILLVVLQDLFIL